MEIALLPEQSFGGFTHRVKITAADLTQTTAATAQTIEAITVKEGDVVLKCATRLITKFKDASDAALATTAIEVGDGGSTARYLASQELNVNGTEITAKGGTGTIYAYTGADTVDVKFLSPGSGKALDDVDTGEVHIYLQIASLPAE